MAKTLIQMSIFWSVLLFLLPSLIFSVEGRVGLECIRFSSFLWEGVGIVFFVSGSLLAITSCIFLVIRGLGSPVPFDCPSKLVERGPYKFVRNPMAVSGIIQGLGIAFWCGSVAILVYVAVGVLVAEFVIRPWEESDLEARFGYDYREYSKRVSRWFPWPKGDK